MSLADHSNIVKCYEYFEAEGNVWIVMELCDGDLYECFIWPNHDIQIPQTEVLKVIH